MLPTAADTDADRLDPGRVLQAAALAEEAGFDGVYVGDHLLHPRPMLESVVTLASIAAQTVRIRIGTAVMLVALRAPLLLSQQLRSLAAFAPGRLTLGAGVGGEYPGEFEAAGVPLGERGRRMEDNLVELKRLMGEDTPPLILGGHSQAALRRAARIGDGWVGYLLSRDSFARRVNLLTQSREELAQSREELGGRGGPFFCGMLLPVYVDTHADVASCRRRASAAWGKLTDTGDAIPDHLYIAGSPAAVVDALHAYREAGCEEILLAPADQGRAYMEQVGTLAEQVLPALR